MPRPAVFFEERKRFHAQLLSGAPISDEKDTPVIADKGSMVSTKITQNLLKELGLSFFKTIQFSNLLPEQHFEDTCVSFLSRTILGLQHLLPGIWTIQSLHREDKRGIGKYSQYAQLYNLAKICRQNRKLMTAINHDYVICPDIVITREPEKDESINQREQLVDSNIVRQSGLRSVNNQAPILHASISCKWTIRSDRAQNARAEALNLIRTRKGHTPHIAVLTAEPLPSRLASLALGTGDLDCIYHFALPELEKAIDNAHAEDAKELLRLMIDGNRLKDIADLPFDLAS